MTLVPDAPDAIASSAGWNVKENMEFLTDIVDRLRDAEYVHRYSWTPILKILKTPQPQAPTAWSCTPSPMPTCIPPIPKSGGSLRRSKPRSPQGRSWRKCRSRPQPRQPKVLPRACTVPQRSVDRTCADFRCPLSRTERNNQAIQGVPCLR